MYRQALIFTVLFVLLLGCTPDANEPIISAADLKQREGQSIAASGTLLPSDVSVRKPVALQMADGAHIYIGSFTSDSGLDMARLDPFYSHSVVINGIIYTGAIPPSHQIISRLDGPYLVDITSIRVVDQK